ncbi:General transcription factor IIH subunit 2 [Dictyocoela muelleri]|nr:General transcription factor IIH subunit 2 [Dictyocoela muelleri]
MDTFSWEREYRKTWDTSGDNEKQIYEINTNNNFKKGIIKHLHFILDTSEAIENIDFPPTVKFNLAQILKKFCKNFIIQNPLSKLTALSVKNGAVEKYSHFDEDVVDEYLGKGCGDFSLSNAMVASLDLLNTDLVQKNDIESLKSTVNTSKCDLIKEIIVIVTAVNSADSDIEFLSRLNDVTVHFISLNGEIGLFKKISKMTNGMFFVPQTVDHLEAIILNFCRPTPVNTQVCMNILGFPKKDDDLSICACHFELKEGYICPLCNTKVCSLPIKCPICDTQLVSSINLTQNLYNTFNIPKFQDCDGLCFVCENKAQKKCPRCDAKFCRKCYNVVYEVNFCLNCQ